MTVDQITRFDAAKSKVAAAKIAVDDTEAAEAMLQQAKADARAAHAQAHVDFQILTQELLLAADEVGDVPG